MKTKRAGEIRPGDIVDLEGDPIADPDGDNACFECEYQTVCQVDRETPDCVVIYLEGASGYGFPPDHPIKLDPDGRREPEYDESA